MSTEERFRADCPDVREWDGELIHPDCGHCARNRLADLCAAYREACDTSDYSDFGASPPRYQAAARFRAAVNPDDVCAVIDELGERR